MTRLFPSSFGVLVFASLPLLSLVSADAVDFHYYPAAAQPCLFQASNSSKCDPSSVPKYNGCVCSNGGGFLDTAASCLGSSDSGDLNTVYKTMSSNCGDSGTPIAINLQQWLAKAGSSSPSDKSSSDSAKTTTETKSPDTIKTTLVVTASASQSTPLVSTVTLGSASGTSSASVAVVTVTPGQATVITITSAAPTGAAGTAASQTTGSSSSSSPTASSSGGGSKLGTGAIAGIAVGAAVVAAVAVGALFWLCFRRRSNRPGTADPSHDTVAPSNDPYSGPEVKPTHPSYTTPQAMPPPVQEAHKYTYTNQTAPPQQIYNQQSPYQAYQPQPQPGYPPQQGGFPLQQGAYAQPHGGAMELQGGNVQAPTELPGGRY